MRRTGGDASKKRETDVACDVNQIELGVLSEEVEIAEYVTHDGFALRRAVNGDAHTHAVLFRNQVGANDQHRHLGAGEHAARDGAEEKPLEARAAARPHDHEVRFGAIDFVGDTLGRIAHDVDFLNRKVFAFEELADGLEDLFRTILVIALKCFTLDKAQGTGRNLRHDGEHFDFGRASKEAFTRSKEFKCVVGIDATVNGNQDFHKHPSSSVGAYWLQLVLRNKLETVIAAPDSLIVTPSVELISEKFFLFLLRY